MRDHQSDRPVQSEKPAYFAGFFFVRVVGLLSAACAWVVLRRYAAWVAYLALPKARRLDRVAMRQVRRSYVSALVN